MPKHLRKIIIAVLIIAIAVFIFIFKASLTKAAWYNSSWGYRKQIAITGSTDGAQTNYQVKLLVGESSGSVGYNVHCEGHCKTDFSDLRFTTSDGTTLISYWIKSTSGTTPN
jgi:hypothetical protein